MYAEVQENRIAVGLAAGQNKPAIGREITRTVGHELQLEFARDRLAGESTSRIREIKTA